jgi:hypothetical protein
LADLESGKARIRGVGRFGAVAAAALVGVVAGVGCSGGDDAASVAQDRPDPPRRFKSRGLAVALPRSWPPPVGFSEQAYPPRLTISSFRIDGYDGEGDCAPQVAVDQLPEKGILIFVIDMTGSSDGAHAPPRPASFELDPTTLAIRECFGESYEVTLAESGRSLIVYVTLGRKAGELERSQAVAVLNSFELRRSRWRAAPSGG